MSMNLGFGGVNFNTLETIKGIAFYSLQKFPVNDVLKTGNNVIQLLETFKQTHPDRIPKNTLHDGGLLAFDTGSIIVSVNVNDFELALHLLNTNDPSMALLVKEAKAVPVLLAYLAVITIGVHLPDASVLESALPFTVNSLKFDIADQERWNTKLRTEVERLLPLANKGAKFKGKKLGALGPLAKAVRRHLKSRRRDNAEAVWAALVANPPKGMTFQDNRTGKYVEYDKRTYVGNLKNTGYRRFVNTVTEQKKKLKSLTV